MKVDPPHEDDAPSLVPGDVVRGRGSTLSMAEAAWAVGRCAAVVVCLLARRKLRLPRRNLGRVISFADGTSAGVYRETAVVRDVAASPVYLAVTFRLRAIGGNRWAHGLFRAESLLNTVFFAGFPGLISKLWLRHDQSNRYRGLYAWDGSTAALRYVNALWWVLTLVSEPDSIEYALVPGVDWTQVLAAPSVLVELGEEGSVDWWRPTSSVQAQALAPRTDIEDSSS